MEIICDRSETLAVLQRCRERRIALFAPNGELPAEIEGLCMGAQRFADEHGIAELPVAIGMTGVYHDNPDITPIEQLRAEACMTVPEGTKTRGDISTMTIPGGTFAVAHVEIDQTQYAEAWDRLICDWLPQSGYQPDDRMCFEMYLNDSRKHPEGKHVVEICEPVRPL